MDQHKKRLTANPSSYSQLSEYPPKPDADPFERMVQFLCTVGKLKSIDRTGWILEGRNIPKPESVAGHMYRMGIIAMLLDEDDDDEDVEPVVVPNETTATEVPEVKKVEATSKKLDINKVVKMSLVHDIAECIVGDITPFDGITEEEKHRRELEAMTHLVSLLPSSSSRKFFNLYEEYESRQTAESQVVKELDRFDVTLQAFQYERSEWIRAKRIVRFDEFFISAELNIRNTKLAPMLQRIITERNQFWNDVIKVEGSHQLTNNNSNGTQEK